MQWTMTREDVQELLDKNILGCQKQKDELKIVYAKVTSLDPFRIKIDGDEASLPYSPLCLFGGSGLFSGDRIVCLFSGKNVIVLGKIEQFDYGLTRCPVGTCWISESSISPAGIFGGIWQKINSRFLVSSGTKYSVGQEGGSDTVKLTIEQMPSHRHNLAQNDNSSSDEAWIAEVALNKFVWSNENIQAVGGGKAHENRPSYHAVNVWVRKG